MSVHNICVVSYVGLLIVTVCVFIAVINCKQNKQPYTLAKFVGHWI